VLQRILELLLVLTVGQSARIQVDNHLIVLQQPMELEQYMQVHPIHQVGTLIVGLSINNNKLWVEEGRHNPGDVINQ
jgi:hypothetical protein